MKAIFAILQTLTGTHIILEQNYYLCNKTNLQIKVSKFSGPPGKEDH